MNVIEVRDVWKKFRLYHDKRPTLKEKILFRGRGKWEDFWALKGVNLSIKKGSTVGLIGQNGSGKSTLLKILTKIIYPNKGSIKIQGKVSSLLELGAGFHPDFTGRENIYMNASIFGLNRKEINQKIDEIISFSELEEFIDNPVRSYSSGMYMRLAFATAINVDPDILLVDEILAVGDTSFQKKCLDKINEFKLKGKTIVFVSHDHGVVEKLCDEAVWIDHGELKAVGTTRRVIDAYLMFMAKREEKRLAKEHQEKEEEYRNQGDESKSAGHKPEDLDTPELGNETERDVPSDRWGSREIEITTVKIFDGQGKEKYLFETGETATIAIYYKVNKEIEKPVFGIGVFRNDGVHSYGTNTYIDKVKIIELPKEGVVKFKIDKLNLIEGTYLLDVAAHAEDGLAYDYQSRRYSFRTVSKVHDIGIIRLEHEWVFEQKEA